MFQATSYSSQGVHITNTEVVQPPVVSVGVDGNMKGVTKRLVYGTPDATVTLYNQGGITMTYPGLKFTKPAVGDTERSGTCWFMVHGVPEGRPFFDLAINLVRPVGRSMPMQVQLQLLTQGTMGATMQTYDGSITLPVGSTEVVSATVEWKDDNQEPITPTFHQSQDDIVSGAQFVYLTLSTTDAVDEAVTILSFSFTCYEPSS